LDSNTILSPISFLTIIPVPRSVNTDLTIVAKNMHLFPIIGALIGIVVGIFSFTISFYLTGYLVGLLVTVAIMLITGMHHADALADFADGLMAKGGREVKRRIMSEPALGTAGTLSLIIYVIGLIIAIAAFNSTLKLFISIISAEIIAKYVMVIIASKSTPAWEGFSSPFTIAMKDKSKIAFASIFTVASITILSGFIGLLAIAVALTVAMIIKTISYRFFGGITGDAFGASNEITRLSSMLIFSQLIL
jgi:adenosylcobinamide-GDP ribazoletransferase